jgi:hypothetical protein
MANTEKRQATAARLMKKSGEPVTEALDYTASLMHALNWYNTNNDNKDKKRWFIEYFGKNAKFNMSDINDREFRTVGTLCRLAKNDQYLEQKELDLIQSEFYRIKELSERKAAVVKPTNTVAVALKPVTIQDRLDDQAAEFVGMFDEMVDAYTLDRKQVPDVKLLMKQRPSAPVAKKALLKIARITDELREAVAGTDKQLVEGYSNFKKPELKKLLAAYEELAEQLNQTKKIVVRKPRATKIVPAGDVVKRLKFAKENQELNLKSVSPTAIVGAEEVWLFNTKYKKLQYYRAVDGMTLTVKGTTLMNFDAAKSEQRTVRKPETVTPLQEKGKRAMAQFLKSLTTKPAAVNGRVNEEVIILAAFK